MSGMTSLSSSGDQVWDMQFPDNSEIITQHIGLDNSIFIGVSQYGQEIENRIYVINSNTGEIKYSFIVDGTFVSNLVIGNNNIYFLISKIDEITNIENTYLYSLSSGPFEPVIIPKFTESSEMEIKTETEIVEQEIEDLEVEQGIDEDGLEEIILALNANPEGENTANIIKKELKDFVSKNGIRVSVLGRGLSTGTELEYSDSETIKNALKNRF